MTDNRFTVRPHFIYAANLLYPYLTLLIIPVVRGLMQYLSDGGGALSSYLAAEAVVLSIAVTVAFLKLRRTRLIFNNGINVTKGLFCRVSYRIPPSASKVIVLESDPILHCLGAYRLKIYTESGLRKKPDECIPICKADAYNIYNLFGVKGEAVRSNTKADVIVSAALSSSAAGLLLSIPAVKVTVSLLGESVPSLLPKLRNAGMSLEWLISVGRYLTIALIIGYFVSFTVLLLRNYGFSSSRSNDRIMLNSGRLPHRTVFLNNRSVNAVRTVTAPLMLLTKKCAVKFSSCGYGRRRGEIGLLVPCVKPSLAKGLVQWLLPDYVTAAERIRPCRKGVRRSMCLPTFMITASAAAVLAVRRFRPEFFKPALLIWLMTAVFAAVLLLMRLYALKNGGFSLSNGMVWIKGLSGLRVNELQCGLKSVHCIRLSQTPFDRRHGHCTVKLRLIGKNRETAAQRYMDYENIRKIFRQKQRRDKI